jgi:hypothetical protein
LEPVRMMPRPLSLRRNQRGQVVPFVTMMLPILLLFVALVVNVGQAVNRRVAVQFLADTSAWTGATVLAAHLNNIAWINDKIQWGWTIMKPLNGFFIFTECEVGDAATAAYQIFSGVLRGAIFVLDAGGQVRAWSEAKRVAFGETGNLPELFPGEQEADFDFWAFRVPGFDLPLMTEEVEDGSNPVSVIDSSWFSGEKNPTWSCGSIVPPFVHSRSANFMLWVKDRGEHKFVVHVTAPEVPARLFPNIFGNLPEMSAVAAARAEGGSLEEGRSEYIVKMVPVGTAWPFDPLNPLNPWSRVVLH